MVVHHKDARGRIIPAVDGTPLVTVIIAVYNDADHLREAAKSVLNQTLRQLELIIVDDASTDATPQVARRLEGEDDRVSYMRMPHNTGGAGAPRNRGMDLARGRYVTFLDSDDLLERHACANLVRTADRDGADVVIGRTRRHDVSKDVSFGWHNQLFREEVTVQSIEDFPELGLDTTVAKLCRTEFLNSNRIRYPEDIHYEDLVFAEDVYRLAGVISVIPENTYVWNVYPAEVRKSITHQRDSLSNIEFRLEALGRIFDNVSHEEWPNLRAVLQKKLVTHDARL